MVLFPEDPNRKIFLKIILKGKSLHFDTISLKELITYLQKKNISVKILWRKDGRQLSLLFEREKVVPK